MEYQFSSFAFVQAHISMELSEAALKRRPQIGNGKYTRLFLSGKIPDDDKWEVYEVYWVDK